MSTPDISRFLKQPGKHYAGVRLQQGRILTDADFNEGAWMREEDQRRGVVDFVGARGAPDLGFKIHQPADLTQPVTIQAGSFYLGGLRLEMEQTQPFRYQRDFLQMGPGDLPTSPTGSGPTYAILYLLNAWEQDISTVEDAELGEPALGGSQTSVRVRRMRRVEGQGIADTSDCYQAFLEAMTKLAGYDSVFDERTGELRSQARLTLLPSQPEQGGSCEDCNPSAGGAYLGADNQTLRIMLTDPDHFVWAKNNAAPLYRARVRNLGTTEVSVKLLDPPLDEEHFPLRGRVVEILPFAALLDDSNDPSGTANPSFNKAPAEIGAFTRVVAPYDPETSSFTVTVDPTVPGTTQAAGFVYAWDAQHPDASRLNVRPSDSESGDKFVYVRFWHQSTAKDFSDIELPIDEAGLGPVLKEVRVQPSFYVRGRRGDFWIATLRPETPGFGIVPVDLQSDHFGAPPDGPRHFYAPLALVRIRDNSFKSIHDCRPRVRPTGDDHCSTVTVGNCYGNVGDFGSIAEAIAALPTAGGVITILPGLYRERIVIERPGVILEGCGENTVLLSPDNSPGVPDNAMIKLRDNCAGARVRSLRIEASEESAIVATNGVDIGFSALHVVGRLTQVGSSSSSSSTNATTDAPLIILTSCDDISLQAIQVDSQRRPGLKVSGCNRLQAEAMSLAGIPDADKAPVAPMITLHDCSDFQMRNLTIMTFGQSGILIQTASDIELSEFTIVSSYSNPKAKTIVQPMPGVDIDGGNRIRLHESQITQTGSEPKEAFYSPHAAVVALGTDIWIQDNLIQALPIKDSEGEDTESLGAWGGVQLRGGSTLVVVRDNRILRGIGHGITLGSVVWTQVDDSAKKQFNLGAGKTLILESTGSVKWGAGGDLSSFSDDDVTQFVPSYEGTLADIVILNNRIERMSSNGISALTVLGLSGSPLSPTDVSLFHVDRLRIAGNTITGNMLWEPPSASQSGHENLVPESRARNPIGAEIQSLPQGGIVLASVGDSIEICNNFIGNNHGTAIGATNGIFILNGEGISIIGNRIQDNGAEASSDPKVKLNRGVRAGIAIMLAGTGVPESLLGVQMALIGEGLSSDGSSVRIIDNVVRQPEGRALHVVAAGPVKIEGNFLSSQGFHGSDNPEDQFAIGDVVLVENVGGPWERVDIEDVEFGRDYVTDTTNYSGTSSLTTMESYLENTVTSSPRFFVGIGGQVLFHNNQVVYDWAVKRSPPSGLGAPLGIFPLAFLTLDHLSVVGNHLSLHIVIPSASSPPPLPDPDLDKVPYIRHTPMLAHVFGAAATLDISANRVAGGVPDTLLSVWGLGELASAMTSNQTTLQNFLRTNNIHFPHSGPLPQRLDSENQVMFQEDLIPRDGGSPAFTFFNDTLHLFFRLLFRPGSAPSP